MEIKLKDCSEPNIHYMNNELKSFGIHDYEFTSRASNQVWASNESMTVTQLKNMYPAFTREGIASIDVYFERCDDNVMDALLTFLDHYSSMDNHTNDVAVVNGIKTLIDRAPQGMSYSHLVDLEGSISESKSAERIISETNDLAREMYRVNGHDVLDNHDFHKSKHPYEKAAWQFACVAQKQLKSIDVQIAIGEKYGSVMNNLENDVSDEWDDSLTMG